LWDPARRIVEFRRTAYDVAAAAKGILEAGLPGESARCLLDPLSCGARAGSVRGAG